MAVKVTGWLISEGSTEEAMVTIATAMPAALAFRGAEVRIKTYVRAGFP